VAATETGLPAQHPRGRQGRSFDCAQDGSKDGERNRTTDRSPERSEGRKRHPPPPTHMRPRLLER